MDAHNAQQTSDESTPLLAASSTSSSTARTDRVPYIRPIVDRLQTTDVDAIDHATIYPNRDDLDTPLAVKTAYTLIVLLSLTTSPHPSSEDAWEEYSTLNPRSQRPVKLGRMILVVWARFLSECKGTEDIETALWYSYPLQPGLLHRAVRGTFSCGYPVITY